MKNEMEEAIEDHTSSTVNWTAEVRRIKRRRRMGKSSPASTKAWGSTISSTASKAFGADPQKYSIKLRRITVHMVDWEDQIVGTLKEGFVSTEERVALNSLEK